jgi:hypothetical protein
MTKRHVLRGRAAASVQVLVVVLNGLVNLGVFISRQDERCSLALEDLFGSGDRRVDKGSDLESRTEFVFESERMAGRQDDSSRRD